MKNGSEKISRRKSGDSPREVITTHINADFDALASLIAASKLYPSAALVFPGSQEKNLRNFFLHTTSYLFNFTKIKKIDFNSIERLILVDTRQKSRIGKFAQLIDKEGLEIHIYDHHPDSKDDIRGNLEVIRQIGSNTALLTQIIQEKKIPITADEATIMALGIHEDTGSFTFSSTTAEDYDAAAWLSRQGANHNLISDMLTRELTTDQLLLLNELVQSAKTFTINSINIIISKVIREEYVGDFAVLVHKFMEMENLNVVFALAQMEDRIYLVARSRIEEVNVAEIALAMGGGGHPQAASATIRRKTLVQVERSLQALLRNRIKPTKRAEDLMSSPVIHTSPDNTMEDAAEIMTRYNINVLLVTDESDALKGYISRQIVEKAVFFGLKEMKVKEYMNIEYHVIQPEAPLKEIQRSIVDNKPRVLPVVKDGKVLGVITRTDLLNTLVGDLQIPEFVPGSKENLQYPRIKGMASILKERLPRNIIKHLKNLGHVADILGYNVYVVGGMVRDILLKRDNLDIDIVVEGEGIEFAHEFAKQYKSRVRSHKKFNTAVLIFPDGFKIDIATARMEYYEAPGAPPIVETSSLKLDLYRRDFTINTLAIQLNKRNYGTLIDYFGGQKDIREKVLRVLHNLSFVEDPTRVFRAIRFEQRFGFKIGKLTLALIKNAVKINCFEDLSDRRLFLELKLLMKEEEPIKSIERLNEFNLLQIISPEINLTDELRQLLEEIRKVIDWYSLLFIEETFDPWKIYWFGLTSQLNKRPLESLAKRMGMVELESKRMLSQRANAKKILDSLYKFNGDNYELYTLLLPYDTETLLYLMAKAGNEKTKRLVSHYFTKLKRTKILLKGKDLVGMGFKPGPVYKKVFDEILKARLNDKVNSREDEISFALAMKSQGHFESNDP
jgi:tRNA nucleotidyltransferase (CCA-adding enzyme)